MYGLAGEVGGEEKESTTLSQPLPHFMISFIVSVLELLEIEVLSVDDAVF